MSAEIVEPMFPVLEATEVAPTLPLATPVEVPVGPPVVVVLDIGKGGSLSELEAVAAVDKTADDSLMVEELPGWVCPVGPVGPAVEVVFAAG